MGLPKPLAADGQVTFDPVSKSLFVKPAKPDFAALKWSQGHQAMIKQAGSYDEPVVHAHVGGSRVRGTAEADGWLKFQIHDAKVFRQLTSEPNLGAYITVDREAGRILGVTFRHRP